MSYYHGTNEIIGEINLNKGRLWTDFGKGFYLTDKWKTAQSWAVRKARISNGTPTVLRYSINDNLFNSPEIKRLRFNSPDTAWLHFIRDNRSRKISKQLMYNYDIVSGPIADDDVAVVIADYIDGVIDEAEAILRARALPATFQMSLHTLTAIGCVDEDNVQYRQFRNGVWTNWTRRKQ